MRRKYRFPDRAMAEQEVQRLESLEIDYHIVVSSILWGSDGDATWFRRGRWKVCLIRPTSPTGGIILQSWHYPGQVPSIEVYSVDRWADHVRHLVEYHIDDEKQDLCRILDEVLVVRQQAWDVKYGKETA